MTLSATNHKQLYEANITRANITRLAVRALAVSRATVAVRALAVRALAVRALAVRALAVRALAVRALAVRALAVRALAVPAHNFIQAVRHTDRSQMSNCGLNFSTLTSNANYLNCDLRSGSSQLGPSQPGTQRQA